MKSAFLTLVAAFAAQQVSGHALFQQLWVDGEDYISLPFVHASQCARVPMSNTPVTNTGSPDIRCNAGGSKGVGAKCPAIGGAHYGPVIVYLSKVADAQTADGSADFFKIFQNGWTSAGAVGDNDNWGVKDMNACCGKVDVPIPADIPDGDYLLRAEVVALHAMPAQLYMTCYQITVSGGSGTAVPAGVKFPGAYSAADPGLTANIHGAISAYVVPGPAVIPSGLEVTAGSGCSAGCQKTCVAGDKPSVHLEVAAPPASPAGGAPAAGGAAGSCEVAKYQQCGGQGYTGCTNCASGSSCDTTNQYYQQCV
ncbi:unnamed protein product [Parascedosporium putredinis]|uniref:lytic cellulose monooxygenase (C4-dehydrogenating) n=1 Tax=Parascedosporium putredinis TaxID=1442378 RepID=A0A9P1H0N2_9PEZI|nr:unnamed protein product [Parascedosporium putredinis]CAI7992274.1 unnamed protein product [Parascedosporium putredinis]